MDRYSIVREWLEQYPQLYGWIGFNAIVTELSAITLKTVPNLNQTRKDILGNKVIDMPFTVEFIKEYTTAQNDTNINAIQEVENFTEWIEEQNANLNYPVFAENEEVTSIEVLQNVPTLVVDTAQSLAHYQVTFKIVYKRKGE